MGEEWQRLRLQVRQGGTGEIGWDRTCSGVGLQVRYDESGTELAEVGTPGQREWRQSCIRVKSATKPIHTRSTSPEMYHTLEIFSTQKMSSNIPE